MSQRCCNVCSEPISWNSATGLCDRCRASKKQCEILDAAQEQFGEARAAIEGEGREWDARKFVEHLFRERMNLLGSGANSGQVIISDIDAAIAEAAYQTGRDAGRAERVLEAAPPKLILKCSQCGCVTPKYLNVQGLGCSECNPAHNVNAAAAPLPTARDILSELSAFLLNMRRDARDSRDVVLENYVEGIEQFVTQLMAAPQPVSGLQRTAGDVLCQFRESGSEDWGELESAINWWAMNEFCPNFTKGDRRLREALERLLKVYEPRYAGEDGMLMPSYYEPQVTEIREARKLALAALESA